jgi:hypothetical protein
MLPKPHRLPEQGPGAAHNDVCCYQDWKYEHATRQTTEFQCWFCGKRWEWDLYAHVWKGKA